MRSNIYSRGIASEPVTFCLVSSSSNFHPLWLVSSVLLWTITRVLDQPAGVSHRHISVVGRVVPSIVAIWIIDMIAGAAEFWPSTFTLDEYRGVEMIRAWNISSILFVYLAILTKLLNLGSSIIALVQLMYGPRWDMYSWHLKIQSIRSKTKRSLSLKMCTYKHGNV